MTVARRLQLAVLSLGQAMVTWRARTCENGTHQRVARARARARHT